MIARRQLLFSALFLLATLLVLMSRSLNDSPSTLSLPRVDLLKNLDLGLSKWATTHNPDSEGELLDIETQSLSSGLHSSSPEDSLAPHSDKTHPSTTTNPLTLTDLNPTNHSQIHSRARIGMITMVFGATNPTYERALRTHQVHAQHHNTPLFTLRKSILEIMYNKPMYILDLLLQELKKPDHERMEWFFWFDADTVIVNPQIPPSAFLPPRDYPHIHFLAAEDINGLNAGVFFLRVCDWSISVMAAVLSYRTFRPHEPLRFDEQSALDLVLRDRPFRAHVALYPQRWFNAYQATTNTLYNETVPLLPWQIHRGDMMVHFAGIPDKTDRMDHYADIFEQHLPEWEVELRYTSYPGEMEQFWGERRTREREERQRREEMKEEARRVLEEGAGKMRLFGEGLERGEREAWEEAREALRGAVENGEGPGGDNGEHEWGGLQRLEGAMKNFTEATAPLLTAESTLRKSTLRHAHETILIAEKISDQYSPSPIINTTSPSNADKDKDLLAEPHKLATQASALRNFLIEHPDKIDEIGVATRALEWAVGQFREGGEGRIRGVLGETGGEGGGDGGGGESDTLNEGKQEGGTNTEEQGERGDGGAAAQTTGSVNGEGQGEEGKSSPVAGLGSTHDRGNSEYSAGGNDGIAAAAAAAGEGYDGGDAAEAGARHGEGDVRLDF